MKRLTSESLSESRAVKICMSGKLKELDKHKIVGIDKQKLNTELMYFVFESL